MSQEFSVEAGNILSGTAVATNSTSAVTIITIPAGRQWVGDVTISVASTAAAIVSATVQTSGTNVVPASGTVVSRVNIGGLTSGGFAAPLRARVRVVAPPQNTVTLQLVNTSATANTSSASANGVLI